MLLLGRGRLHLGGLLLCFRRCRLSDTRALLLPLRDFRLGRNKSAARKGETRLPPDAVLPQSFFALVGLQRVLRVDDKAKYSS